MEGLTHMSATMEKLSSNQVKLTVTIPAEDFDKGMNSAYLKLRKQLTVPGFRKGKAPRKVIENFYGQGVFLEEAFNTIVPGAYDNAISELELNPVDQPEIDIDNIGPGEDCVFTATVYVRPEVTLGQYKGIEVPKAEYSVTDEEVEEEIKAAQERVARWEDVEREAKEQDRVTIDYLGTVDGVPFEGGESTNFPLVLGSGTFIPGFEEQLIGMKKLEEADVKVTFPEDYRAEDLAGKDASFHVLVHEIKEKQIPEINDDFASEVSEFDTLKEYKADLRAKLEEQAKNRAENERMDLIIDKVIENAEADVPEAMVDRQVHAMIDDMEMRMNYQGLRMEDFLRLTGQTHDDLHTQYEPQAKKRVMMELVLDEIRKVEKFEASDAEVEEQIKTYAEQTQSEFEEIKKTLTDTDLDYFKDMVLNQKVIDFLSDNAVDAQPKKKRATKKKADAEDAKAEAAEEEKKPAKKPRKPAAKKTAKAEEGETKE